MTLLSQLRGKLPWVSPVVIVPRPSGDIRLCVDMRRANQAIVRERHPIPTVDDLLYQLNMLNGSGSGMGQDNGGSKLASSYTLFLLLKDNKVFGDIQSTIYGDTLTQVHWTLLQTRDNGKFWIMVLHVQRICKSDREFSSHYFIFSSI